MVGDNFHRKSRLVAQYYADDDGSAISTKAPTVQSSFTTGIIVDRGFHANDDSVHEGHNPSPYPVAIPTGANRLH